MLRPLALSLIVASRVHAKAIYHIEPVHKNSKFYHLSVHPHRTIGLYDFPPLVEVQNWPVDCVYLKCQPASGRRALGHGSLAAVSAVPGWLPDPRAPSNDFCDLRTMLVKPLHPTESVVGMVFWGGWWLQCCLIPKTMEPLKWARDSGLVGLVSATACCSTDALMSTGNVPVMGAGNPIPDFPFLQTTDAPMNFLPSWSVRSSDNASIVGATLLATRCNAQVCTNGVCALASCGNKTQIVYATITSDGQDGLTVDNTLARFLNAIVGIGLILQILYVIYVEVKRWKSFSPLHHFVLVVEGMVCAGFRAYRQFKGPTSGAIAGDVSLPGMWYLDSAGSLEASLSVATTFMTITVFLKVLLASLGCPLSKQKSCILDIVVATTAVLLAATLTFFSILYPFQPWLSFPWLKGLGNKGLKDLTYQPGFVINIVFASVYILAAIPTLFQMLSVARKGNSNAVQKTVRRLFKYIALQVVGLIMVTTAIGLRSNFTMVFYYSMANYGMFWIQIQFQGWGNLLASWGAIMTITSSSSSSSSTAPAAPALLLPAVPSRRLAPAPGPAPRAPRPLAASLLPLVAD